MKKLRTFRLDDVVYTRLESLAKAQHLTKTEILENLITGRASSLLDMQNLTESEPSENFRPLANWQLWDACIKLSDYRDLDKMQVFRDEGIITFSSRTFGFYGIPLDESRAVEIVERIVSNNAPKCLYSEWEQYRFYIDEVDTIFEFLSIPYGEELSYVDTFAECAYTTFEGDLQIVITIDETPTPYLSHEYEGVKYYYQILNPKDSELYIQAKERKKRIEKLTHLANAKYEHPDNAISAFGTAFMEFDIQRYLGAAPKTIDELKSLYKAKARELHPDVNKSEFADLEFQALNGCKSYYEAKLSGLKSGVTGRLR